ncbi:hypothetical protein GE115_13860 [Agromyces sp. CFH 90414]|uniref:Virulence RhuM family protein n=1 Tax=Agromyces agglutinans TaxID=2662258 RepID=A0A6I2F815_9MICO|nr:RhuM family protein [Agromyces agglutinans]MRG60942.1 hypothetical protein [Agromyces agglutinans]
MKTIGKHVANARREELVDIPVVAKFATTAADGKSYLTEHYNLDMVLSVGYRVKSAEGVHLCRWANDVVKRYMLNGYALNEHSEGPAAHRRQQTQRTALERPKEKDLMVALLVSMLTDEASWR